MQRGSRPKRSARPKAKRSKIRKGRIYDPSYLEWQHKQPCCVSGSRGEPVIGGHLTVHHVRFCGSPKDDTRTIPLLAYLHQLVFKRKGVVCIEDGKERFEEHYGVSIEALIAQHRERYKNEIRSKG